MDHATFLRHIEESLCAESDNATMADRLEDLTGWDSIGALAVIAVIDEQYGLPLDVGALLECVTVGDLASLVEKDLVKTA